MYSQAIIALIFIDALSSALVSVGLRLTIKPIVESIIPTPFTISRYSFWQLFSLKMGKKILTMEPFLPFFEKLERKS